MGTPVLKGTGVPFFLGTVLHRESDFLHRNLGPYTASRTRRLSGGETMSIASHRGPLPLLNVNKEERSNRRRQPTLRAHAVRALPRDVVPVRGARVCGRLRGSVRGAQAQVSGGRDTVAGIHEPDLGSTRRWGRTRAVADPSRGRSPLCDSVWHHRAGSVLRRTRQAVVGDADEDSGVVGEEAPVCMGLVYLFRN